MEKPVCDFLLVINSNGHPISYRFEVIADCCLNFRHFAFYSPLWELRVNAHYSSSAHWKGVLDFLVELIELFSLAVTAEALLANIE